MYDLYTCRFCDEIVVRVPHPLTITDESTPTPKTIEALIEAHVAMHTCEMTQP